MVTGAPTSVLVPPIIVSRLPASASAFVEREERIDPVSQSVIDLHVSHTRRVEALTSLNTVVYGNLGLLMSVTTTAAVLATVKAICST